jgi:curved DNA-binding protein CbpA
MDEIIVDDISFDPYFILGVTPDDTLEHITKEYRRKAKLSHPDKLSLQDRENPDKVLKKSKQFKLLVDCYEYICNKQNRYNNKNRESVNVQLYEDIPSQSFDNSNDLDSFNRKFSSMRVEKPNDFGYKTDRMPALDDTGKNFEELKRQYGSVEYKPQQLFDDKNFNSKNFNAAFEYQQQQHSDTVDKSQLIIHKTSDGFNAYNSATLDNCASVSNFNGLMLVGDNFGQSGIGYNEGNYSDYRQTFNAPRNPERLDIPDDFKPSSMTVKPLSRREIEEQLRLREQFLVSSSGNGSKTDYAKQEQMLLEKQKQEMKTQAEQDRQFILQYQQMYDRQTIEDAMNNRLLTSDYQSFDLNANPSINQNTRTRRN